MFKNFLMVSLIFILFYLLVNVSSMLTDHINQSPVTISKSFGNNYYHNNY